MEKQTYTFIMPPITLMGAGCADELGTYATNYGLKKALIVTDRILREVGLVSKLTSILDKAGIAYGIYDGVKPNPSTRNIEDGVGILRENQCDFVISFGGGSAHDAAKGIALVATNGGGIEDYEGVDISEKPQLTLFAVNTTAGTASEMTKFCIITDEKRHVKMAIVDKNTTPVLAINDPLFMMEMPKSLTAATGMDALTHAIEAYVSTQATPVTDASALMAIKLVSENLRTAVKDGSDFNARDKMAYAEYLAGMAFNNAGLGYVHAMAHQLGGMYDLPHGVCNAILLPHVEEYNAEAVPERFIEIAKALGEDVTGLKPHEAAKVAIHAIKQLSQDVNIPSGLAELGVKEEDFSLLAENAMKDACGPTNPIIPTKEEVIALFKKAMVGEAIAQ